MPEAGIAGFYNDWHGPADGGFTPKWETFHLSQVLPWIDASFNTVKNKSGRAVAGLSMGGFGALKYAADRPDLFSAVGAFSPGTDISGNLPAGATTVPDNVGEVKIANDAMWEVGAAIGAVSLSNPEFTNGKFRVNAYRNGSVDPDQIAQLKYRGATLFGPMTTTTAADGLRRTWTGRWSTRSTWPPAGSTRPTAGRSASTRAAARRSPT